MAELWGRSAGVNRKIKKLYANVGGVNREIKQLWAKQDGVNRKIFQNAVTWTWDKDEEPGYSNYSWFMNSDPSYAGYDMQVEARDSGASVKVQFTFTFSDPLPLPAGTSVVMDIESTMWPASSDNAVFEVRFIESESGTESTVLHDYISSNSDYNYKTKTYEVESDITVSKIVCYIFVPYKHNAEDPDDGNEGRMTVTIRRPGESSFRLNGTNTSDQ